MLVFTCKLIKKIGTSNTLSTANEITYKLLFAFFPFLIFLLTVMGFFTLDIFSLTNLIEGIVPEDVLLFIEGIAGDVINVRRPQVLSISLLFTIFSASMGFKSLLKGINRAYYDETYDRSTVKILGLSLLLVNIFSVVLVASLSILIFGDNIIYILDSFFNFHESFEIILKIVSMTISIFMMLFVAVLINKLALSNKTPIKKLLPGAAFTVIMWVVSSIGLSIYVKNFARFASVYGSVAGIMVFMIWLNIICTVVLIGSAINSILFEKDFNVYKT